MYRIMHWLILVCFSIVIYERQLATACHAGHSKQDGDDYYDYDYDEYYEEHGEDNQTHTRAKRQTPQQYGDDFQVLREYFRACMLDRVEDPWDWKSIIDFSILKTLWFLYSGTVACTEEGNKDTAVCWKDCIDVYLRNNSTLIQPAKDCVDQYEKDFGFGKAVYTPVYAKTEKRTHGAQGKYSECVQAQYNEADPLTLFTNTGVLAVPAEADLDINSVVTFIRGHVICVICDYSVLPSGQSKPDFKENVDIDGKDIVDGPVVYSVTWPFSFEALIRRDARLRSAIHFCNQELEGTFRKDPPPNLGWTQWYAWNDCNAVCGSSGTQSRQRVCLDENGINCFGDKVQSKICHNRNCAYWSTWGDYTPCIATCDISEKYSFRHCKNGNIGDEGCQGERRRSKSCAVAACEVPWSQWSTCTATCGRGMQKRTGGVSLLKMKTETRSCMPRRCPQQWSLWSPWGPCSTTCGKRGTRHRLRNCLSKTPCTGPSRQSDVCGKNHLPCRETWSEWSLWSECVYKKRTRVCSSGNSCPGENEMYQRCSATDCNKQSSPPVWSKWAPWSACSATCGYSARWRFRQCEVGTSHRPGACPGKRTEQKSCNYRQCYTSVHEPCQNHFKWDAVCKTGGVNCNKEEGWKWCKKTCGYCHTGRF